MKGFSLLCGAPGYRRGLLFSLLARGWGEGFMKDIKDVPKFSNLFCYGKCLKVPKLVGIAELHCLKVEVI